MSDEYKKGLREVEVFMLFLKASMIDEDQSRVQKRSPPEPDILCHFRNGETVAFELVELCDPNLAKAFADPLNPANQYIRTSDPSGSIFQKKIGRIYETPYPIELLCYADGRIATPTDVIIPTAKRELQGCSHIFRRAWLLRRASIHLLWE